MSIVLLSSPNAAAFSGSEEKGVHDPLVRFTAEQYHVMIQQGVIPEDGTIELLNGQLVRKDRGAPGKDPMSHDPLHALAIKLLTGLSAKITNASRHLQIQLPVACSDDSEPEPDAAIVRGKPRDYIERLVSAADVSCVVEVSYSSLKRDQATKLAIYAAAGIPQAVLVNLNNRTLEVYSDPDSSNGQYRTKTTLDSGQLLTLRLPEGVLDVPAADILP
jgi:hypothetical protein